MLSDGQHTVLACARKGSLRISRAGISRADMVSRPSPPHRMWKCAQSLFLICLEVRRTHRQRASSWARHGPILHTRAPLCARRPVKAAEQKLLALEAPRAGGRECASALAPRFLFSSSPPRRDTPHTVHASLLSHFSLRTLHFAPRTSHFSTRHHTTRHDYTITYLSDHHHYHHYHHLHHNPFPRAPSSRALLLRASARHHAWRPTQPSRGPRHPGIRTQQPSWI